MNHSTPTLIACAGPTPCVEVIAKLQATDITERSGLDDPPLRKKPESVSVAHLEEQQMRPRS